MILFPVGLYAPAASAGTPGVAFDPAKKGAGVTLSNSNYTATRGSSNGVVLGLTGKSAGKWYWEVQIDNLGTTTLGIGQSGSQNDAYLGLTNGIATGGTDTNWVSNNVNSGAAPGYTTGDRVSFALDMDNGKLWIRKNGGTWYGSASGGNPAANTSGFSVSAGTWYVGATTYTSPSQVTLKTASTDWSYTAPSGFAQWS